MSLLKTTKIFCKSIPQNEILTKSLIEIYPQAEQGYIQDVFKKYLDPSDLPKESTYSYQVLTPSGNWIEAEFSSAREDYRYTVEFDNDTKVTLSEFNLQPIKRYVDSEQELIKVNELKVGYWCPFLEYDNNSPTPNINYHKIKSIKFGHPFDNLIRVYINDPEELFVLANGLIVHI